MATNKAVGFTVDPPPLVTAPYGVINRLTLQPDTTRWEGGVGYESLTCSGGYQTWDPCSDTPDYDVPRVPPKQVFGPVFGLTADNPCPSTLNGASRKEAADQAAALLQMRTPYLVEQELKWGVQSSRHLPEGRWLTHPDTVILPAGEPDGVCAATAMALLEDAYAYCSGQLGMLHMTRGTASQLQNLTVDDGVLFSNVGTPIIAGTGYSSCPDGPAFGDDSCATWMFISGPVQLWLSDITVYPGDLGQAVTIATNDINFRAERLAAITFDGCCVFAVKVDLTKTC